MPSATYLLFAEAMQNFKQILCVYDGCARELCAVILGHTDGEEVVLAYQFGGSGKKALPPGGQWKCLHLAKVSEVQLRDGPWHAASSHTRRQQCVADVDLDVNPASPYNPRRRL